MLATTLKDEEEPVSSVAGSWSMACGDRAPSDGVGPTSWHGAIVGNHFFGAIYVRGEAFWERIGALVGWEEDLECRLKISMKAPICDG